MSPRRKPLAPEITPGTEVGPYRVEEQLGAGGFGTVFRAESGGELFALKLLALQEVGEWAEREVVVLARVKHPNVVRLRGFWQWPEHAPRYLVVVMEYVPGRRLDIWTRTENPSARQALHLILGVARGLAEAHRAKVIHRDVKEANIIVREPEGEAVLVDFGVSGCAEASRVTGGMMPPGTVEYRSPEAWRFRLENKGDARARYLPTPADDVYALGVVLYWLLTDVLPFPECDGPGLEALLTRAPVAPHVRNPRVPLALSELCLRLLVKEPATRPDAEAVCVAVEELLGRGGQEWEAPLCEEFSEETLSTEPGEEVDDEALWLNRLRQAEARPRRGRRPPHGGELSAPMDPPRVPAADAAPPEPGGPARSTLTGGSAHEVMRQWGRVAAVIVVALSAIAAFSSALRPLLSAPPATTAPAARPQAPEGTGFAASLPTWEEGWKVAPALKPPEATPVPVAPAATLEGDDTSVKTPQKKQRGLGAVKKALVTGAVCATLACSSAPVRPTPEPKPCPPGAIEAMEERGMKNEVGGFLGIFPGDEDRGARIITIREGWTNILLRDRWGALGPDTIFSGEIIIGEQRVHVWLTQARTKDGTFPVCIELRDLPYRPGLPRRGNGDPTSAKVGNAGLLVAVDHFE